ncbi:MAG: PIN domain-containing protein [Deltaproteobacteria bacterium]|nr:PIN domain-containing protein [Deltaproteobacteria bacterium]
MDLLIDTNVLVASVFSGHHHFEASHLLVRNIIAQNIKKAIALHSLAECFSTISNLEAHYDFYFPENNTYDLIQENIQPHFEIISLDQNDYLSAMKRISRLQLKGGIIYDALILEAALKKNIPQLVTWNKKDFLKHAEVILKFLSPFELIILLEPN